MSQRIFVAAIFCITLCTTPLFAVAQQDNDHQIDKTQAANKARKQVNGRVLKVDQQSDRYRVKVLKKSGRVISVDVDKRSGKVNQTNKKDNNR
ncbi:PepSY domain-containing protein [Salinimonas lutimaris]|uniref:PepSY domain-containing protein n=1 Tax=Salinimonas lutimaris TaxID=914153 RepID=UPI0010C0578D|nr:PepSY domain-containing protein [Salinimonas lutimaris]